MALNWYLQLRNLCKTDETAAQLFEQLKKAQTDDEKENAKTNAQNYIQALQSEPVEPEQTETIVETEDSDVVCGSSEPDSVETVSVGNEINTETTDEKIEESRQESTEKSTLLDLSQPAFNPRLSKFGITREEELFLHGVFVRKLTREDKILMRRNIYQKKTVGAAKIQEAYRQKRIEQKIKDANDPEKIRYNQERKYVNAIVDALTNNCNVGWVFRNIEGLTPDIFRELIAKPGIANSIRLANPDFIDNFHKQYDK